MQDILGNIGGCQDCHHIEQNHPLNGKSSVPIILGAKFPRFFLMNFSKNQEKYLNFF